MAEHSVLTALRAAHAALDAVAAPEGDGSESAWVPMTGMTRHELAEVLRLEAALEGRASSLRLQAVAEAERSGAADASAMTGTPAWAAAAGQNRSRAWGAVWLANLLDERYHHTRAALAAGRLSEDHAEVIVRAAEKVPASVSDADLADCEAILVEKAQSMPPQRLRRAARRLLEPLGKKLADAHEQELLESEERRARVATSMTLGDNGDGTWTGKFTVPELHGTLLLSVLEKLSGPRRWARLDAEGQGGDHRAEPVGQDQDGPEADEQARLEQTMPRGSHAERLGAAFCEVLEHLPTTGHSRSGIQLVVHVQEAALREDLGAATLETGAKISVGEARRLACEAGILPLVLGGESQPLDLGASARLFTRAQALALSARHETCAAEGCDRPFAWCELHHEVPWSEGGLTDLDNAAPLCGYHHRRVHDRHWRHEWLPDGALRFHPGRSCYRLDDAIVRSRGSAA